MASVPWIRLYTSWPKHGKTMRLRRLLGTAEPILSLWCWAAENAKDGDLSGFNDDEIEAAADWRGEPGKAVSGMLDAGFLVRANTGLVLHEWLEHAGAGVAHLLKNRENQREVMRQRRAQKLPPDPEDQIQSKSKSNSKSVIANAGVSVMPNSTGNEVLTLVPLDGEPESLSEEIRTVLAHYKTHHPRMRAEPKPGSREWRCIRDRLNEGTQVSDLCRAIDGYHKSPFHTGENDRHATYLGLDLIMRDASHVTKGIEMSEQEPVRRTPEEW